MQQIIYKIDNWALVKLLGGVALVFTAIIAFSFKYLSVRLTQLSQHGYNRDLEDVKGDILKNNGLLNSLVENYFSSSQKILDKKIEAYELLWSCILSIKESFPAGISLVYQLLTDSEFEKIKAFEDLNSNPKMGPILRSYKMEIEIAKMIDNGKKLSSLKPYISDSSFKLFYTYQGLIGRVTHKFIWDYENKILYNWKKDGNLDTILSITLTKKELNYIKKDINIGALNSLIDLLEYKILQDFRNSLNIRETTTDTVEYLKDFEKILTTSKNKHEFR